MKEMEFSTPRGPVWWWSREMRWIPLRNHTGWLELVRFNRQMCLEMSLMRSVSCMNCRSLTDWWLGVHRERRRERTQPWGELLFFSFGAWGVFPQLTILFPARQEVNDPSAGGVWHVKDDHSWKHRWILVTADQWFLLLSLKETPSLLRTYGGDLSDDGNLSGDYLDCCSLAVKLGCACSKPSYLLNLLSTLCSLQNDYQHNQTYRAVHVSHRSTGWPHKSKVDSWY